MEYKYLTAHAFLIRDFLASEECAEFIALAEGRGFDEAPINSLFGTLRARASATTIG